MLEILYWKFYGLNRTMQYGNLKFYLDKFYYNYVVWKLEILCWKFYDRNFIITMQYGNCYWRVNLFMKNLYIKEVAHQSNSAVTSKKLHKIYMNITFYYNI